MAAQVRVRGRLSGPDREPRDASARRLPSEPRAAPLACELPQLVQRIELRALRAGEREHVLSGLRGGVEQALDRDGHRVRGMPIAIRDRHGGHELPYERSGT